MPNILDDIAARLAALEQAVTALAEQAQQAPTTDDSIWSGGAIAVTDAPDVYGISRGELYRRMAAGTLPWSKPARDRLVPKKALEAILKENEVSADTEFEPTGKLDFELSCLGAKVK